jgi:hypothetical protein
MASWQTSPIDYGFRVVRRDEGVAQHVDACGSWRDRFQARLIDVQVNQHLSSRGGFY